ncbi:MAG: UvrD-helicase domain-containing protein [Sphaerobacter sp.]|nr:UvrD-helicase domain-containing protein [Sphaerobacter sp.]
MGSDLLQGLNEAQRRAVTTTEGPVLVVAGPGSGKTRVLTHRVAYLIEHRGVSPWNILAVTFTNKAAREMRTRLEDLVGPERARQLNVGTFHALCVRILRRDGHLIGLDPRFTIYDDADQVDAVRQALKALNIDPKQFPPRPILSRISAAKSQMVGPQRFAEQVETYWEEVVSRVYPRYQETLRRNRALDFDDLLVETVRLFDEQPDTLRQYQDRYRYILVDEYQDTNHVQYLLVRALSAAHRNLCVVGDPDQSIYGWRQADIRNILDFKRDFPDAAEVHLELNYRSTAVIVRAADHVIRANTQRIHRQLRTENPPGERITVREAFDEAQEAQFVVGEIRRLVQSGRYRYRDIAVLYRTNAQSRPLEEALVRADTPYQLVGGTRFYERREIKDALALLRLIANPNDAVSLQRVLANTPLGKGIGARTLQELERWSAEHGLPVFTGLAALAGDSAAPPPPVGTRPAKLLVDAYRVIADLGVKSRSLTLSALFDVAVDQTGFAAQFQDTGDPEALERWENVLQLRNVLMTYDELPEGEALETFLEESALIADADTIDEGGDQVTLITLHAAKGLEFPVVFLVGVEEGILPHARSMESELQVEEERRLFYVGLTRAKERLYVTHTFRRTVWGRDDVSVRSRFLDAIPPELIDGSALRAATPRPTAAGATPPPAAAPTVRLRVGLRVFHPRFGDGIVIAVRESRGDQEVTVDFKRHGQKRLLASLANLSVD